MPPSLGFPTVDAASDSEDDYLVTNALRRPRAKAVSAAAPTRAAASKKGDKSKVATPGNEFASLGLSAGMCAALSGAGYKLPTAVQRRAMPAILGGRDAVVMARTGAGKTAAFLAPLLDALCNAPAPIGGANGPRALVLAPTRELALQTYKFYRQYSRGGHAQLRAAVLVGGTPLDAQFDTLAVCPDLLVATPGRCLQLLAEMGKARGAALTLATATSVVFDEADRLFEGTLAAETAAILGHLGKAPSRQTVLVSATMPSALVEFSRTGLRANAEVVRMDTHDALPAKLATAFVTVRGGDEKDAALLVVLREVLAAERSALVFAATHRAVEYVVSLVEATLGARIDAVHGGMDQGARVEAVARFRKRSSDVLVVTDVAARGIDLPALDVVINYDYPGTPKLFVHRVGRAARAGREGWALSIVAPEETPYLLDTHLFLGRGVSETADDAKPVAEAWTSCVAALSASFVLGEIPKIVLDEEVELVRKTVDDVDIDKLRTSANNAHGLYVRTRPSASGQSVKRAKAMWRDSAGGRRTLNVHPWFSHMATSAENRASALAAEVSQWKPKASAIPIPNVLRERKRRREIRANAEKSLEAAPPLADGDLAMSSARGTIDLSTAESKAVAAASTPKASKRRRRQDAAAEQRAQFFVPMQRLRANGDDNGAEADDGMGAFRALQGAAMDLHADTNNDLLRNRNAGAHRGGRYWDRVSKKFVHADAAERSSRSRNIHVTSREAKAKAAGTLDYSLGDGVMYKRWLAKNEKSVAKRKEAMRDGLPAEATPSSRGTGTAVGANDFRRGAPGRRARVMAAARAKQGGGDGGESEIKTKDEIKRARKERKKAELRRMNKVDRKKKRSGGVSKENNVGRQARSSRIRVISRK